MEYNEKQIQIIEAAEQLFADKGFDGTSVRNIAEEAGINIAMISYYFGSKEKLMEALFEHRTGHIRLKVESLLKDDSHTPLEKMNVLIDEYIDRVMKKQQFYKIMICEQVINKNPVIIRLSNCLKIRNAEIITMLIKDGQKKGAFNKNIDVIMMLNTMIGTVTQMMISKDYYREFNKLSSVSDEKFEALLKQKLGDHIKNLFKAIFIYEA